MRGLMRSALVATALGLGLQVITTPEDRRVVTRSLSRSLPPIKRKTRYVGQTDEQKVEAKRVAQVRRDHRGMKRAWDDNRCLSNNYHHPYHWQI